jgi:hypothetical protein
MGNRRITGGWRGFGCLICHNSAYTTAPLSGTKMAKANDVLQREDVSHALLGTVPSFEDEFHTISLLLKMRSNYQILNYVRRGHEKEGIVFVLYSRIKM